MDCKKKKSRAQKEKLVAREKEIGLNPNLTNRCLCEEQQDILLQIQNNIPIYKWHYLVSKKNETQHPYDDYKTAKNKLEELKAYCIQILNDTEADQLGDAIENLVSLDKVNLRIITTRANYHKKAFKKYAKDEMLDEYFSDTKRKDLISILDFIFDHYEFSELEKKVFIDPPEDYNANNENIMAYIESLL